MAGSCSEWSWGWCAWMFCLATRLLFATELMQASCLFWPLYKWFLTVHPSILVPDSRQSLDAELPDIHSYNYFRMCSCYHHKPALEQDGAKSDSATSTPPPAPCSCPLLCAQKAHSDRALSLPGFDQFHLPAARFAVFYQGCCFSSWFFKWTTSYQENVWCRNIKARQQTLGVGTQIQSSLSILITSALPSPFYSVHLKWSDI